MGTYDRFIPETEHSSWLEDTVEYEFPLGWLGNSSHAPTPAAAGNGCLNTATGSLQNNSYRTATTRSIPDGQGENQSRAAELIFNF